MATVTMEPGSTYQENISGTAMGTGPGSYSRLLLTGAGQFIASGAVLDVNLNLPGTIGTADGGIVGKIAALSQPGGLSRTSSSTTSPPAIGDSFRIVTADGGIVGKFSGFSQPDGLSPNTRLAIFYDPFGDNSIDLSVVPTSYASYLQGIGANENARSAGSAINQILAADQAGNSTKAQEQLAYMISGLSATALPGTITALAGEVHAEIAAVAPQAGQWLQTSVERQLEFSSADGEVGAPDPGKAFWFDATASHGGWDSDDRASGFTVNRSQFTVGFDLLAGQGNAAGIGFSHSLAVVSSPVASGSIYENLGFAYGQYSLKPLIFDAMLGGGTNRWQTSRADPLGLTAQTLDAASAGSSELFSAGIRLPWHVGSLMLEPFARTLWQRTARDAFDEGSVQDAISGPEYSATGVRTMGGVLLGPANPSPLASLFTYQINLAAGYDSGSLTHPTVAANLGGTPTTILAPDVGRAFAQLNFNGTARLGQSTYAYFGLMDEQRSGKSEEAGINAGVRATF
jgi:outer membrane autotransporter protein